MRSKNLNLRSGNLLFLPRTHTMTFDGDISQEVVRAMVRYVHDCSRIFLKSFEKKITR
jgi:hypothetical protein